MSFFNEEQIKAMGTDEYICRECGELMEFEDEWEDILVCVHCGHSVELERYGLEDDEAYDTLYPSREMVLGLPDDEDGDEDDPDNNAEYDNDEEYG